MSLTFLPRPRLLQWIEREGAPHVSLLLAPGGYGKSVLLSQLLDNHKRTIRIDLRETQGEAHSMVSALATGLSEIDEALGARLHAANQAKPLSAAQTARELQRLPPGLLLIDHAERLQLDGETWLLELMRLLPEQHRLVVAGRSLQSFELPLLVAQSVVQVIGPEQLAFDPAEVAQIAAGTQTGAEALEALRGWPLAVKLSVSGAYGQNVATLLRAMLRALPQELQQLLPRLAPYDRWSEHLPRELGLPVSRDWQVQLLMSNLPILVAEDGQARPHEVLLDILDEELRHDQPVWQDSYREAARRALQGGLALRAIALLRRVGLEDEALQMAGAVAPELDKRGQYGVLSELLGSIPEAKLHLSPQLTVLYGLSLIETEQIQSGMAVLARVAQQPQERWRALPALAYGNFMLARLQDAQQQIEEAGQDLARFDFAALLQLKVSEGGVLREQGENEQSLAVLLEAAALARQHSALEQLANVLTSLNVTYLRLNRGDEAMAVIEQSLALYEELGMFSRMTTPLVNMAVSHRSRDELEASRRSLLKAERFAQLQNTKSLTSIYFGLGNTAQLEGQFNEAAAYLMKCAGQARATGRTNFEYMAELLLSETYRAMHEDELADRHLHMGEQLLGEFPQLQSSFVLKSLILFMQGQRAYGQGRLDEASTIFAQFPDGAGGIAAWYPRAQLMLAQIALQQNRPVRPHLERFVEKHLIQEGVRYLTPDLDIVQPVLHAAVGQGWFVPELQPFLREIQQPIQRLEVQTLGALQIRLNGRPLELAGRNVARARELLALLGLLPPPTSSDLHNALIGTGRGDHRNALNTLRQSLVRATGLTEPLVQDQQRRYVLHPQLELRTDIQELKYATQTRNIEMIRELLQRGDFLPGLEREWVNDLRQEDITPLFLTAYDELGSDAVEGKRYAEALKWYEQMLRLDPWQEKAIRTMQEIYRAQGDQRQVERLEREFGHQLA